MATHQQRDGQRQPQNEFERRPQHAHQLHQPQAAPHILPIRRLKRGDLRLLLRKRPHQPRAGEVLLRLRRNLGEHRLDALEPLLNLAAHVCTSTLASGSGTTQPASGTG